MLISGLVKSSMIDYPEKIAAVVFTAGCNFRCPYCHNPDIVFGGGKIKEEDFFDFLSSRKNKLDGVVVSGGEPTLQKDLAQFLKKIKELNFSIKLDTNGSKPEIIGEIIKNNLADYIAMDIKGPLERYPEITKSSIDVEKIKETMKILGKSGVKFEYRTTIVQGMLSYEDFIKIADSFKQFGVPEKYFLQNFRPDVTLDENYKNMKPLNANETEKIKEYFDKICFCSIR